ncbi:Os06g0258701 [Oryza sativa Japonica Group]|uniref:Os06g0258701 protein n=1 Tax=Oryza sativa subsp. japonica TaxID=39947 RepID=A0A0P0WVB4_ORYSJ|nr:Os06g0258701 [Oryza sativa Japonica Group]
MAVAEPVTMTPCSPTCALIALTACMSAACLATPPMRLVLRHVSRIPSVCWVAPPSLRWPRTHHHHHSARSTLQGVLVLGEEGLHVLPKRAL